MAKAIITCIIFCLGFMLTRAQTATVILNIEGIKTAKGGELSAGIFTKGNFPVIGKELKEIKKTVTDSVMQIVFTQIPDGQYAVAVFQDEDKDKKLKANLIGMPTEPIGFSNDARIILGPPAFKQAAVHVEAGKTVVLKIILH